MQYQLNQKIGFLHSQKSDEKQFNRLFRAICLVNKKFLEIKVGNPKDKGELRNHKERVFAYELYRQWANILDAESKKELILNAELDKIIGDDIKNSQVLTYPDLVLHQGQGNKRKQKIICEIKRNDPPKRYTRLFADLYKLSCYLDESMMGGGKFDYGVFILLSTTLEDIKKIKENSKIKVNNDVFLFSDFIKCKSENFDKLICISYDGVKLEYETLSSILKR
jgi:hypothetical protein